MTSRKPWPGPGEQPEGVVNGSDMLYYVAEQHGADVVPLLTTASVETPNGTHLYTRAPAGRTIRNSAGKVGAWIDVRAEGGYTVGPYSEIPGGVYRPVLGWDWLPTPAAAAIAAEVISAPSSWVQSADLLTFPGWLADLLDPPAPVRDPDGMDTRLDRVASGSPGYLERALDGECERVLAAADGVRNFTLNRAAFSLGTLADAGLDKATVERRLLAAALHIGLGEREAGSTVQSGWEAGTASPREVS